MHLPDLEEYSYEEFIAEDPFGFTFRTEFKGGEARALKVLKTLAIQPDVLGPLLNRLALSSRHPHVVPVVDVDFTEMPYFYATPVYGRRSASSNRWVLPTLEGMMAGLPQTEAIAVLEQLSSGMAHLHRVGVPHFGLRPSNLLIAVDDDGNACIKIANAGQGYQPDLYCVELGDLGFYASPEQLGANLTPGPIDGMRADVYSFGVIAYRLLAGRLPRLADLHQEWKNGSSAEWDFDDPRLYLDHLDASGEITWPSPPSGKVEEVRRALVGQCLALHVEDRPADMREVHAALEALHQEEAIEAERGQLSDELARVRQRLDAQIRTAEEAVRELEIQKRDFGERERQLIAENRKRLEEALAERPAVQASPKAAPVRGGVRPFWRNAAIAISLVSLIATVLAVVFGLGLAAVKKDLGATSAERDTLNRVKKQLEESSNALKRSLSQNVQERAEADAKALASENTKELLAQSNAQTRTMMRLTQRNTDLFFQAMLKNRESDVPGFRAERRQLLAEGRVYYGQIINLFSNEPDFVLTVASAHRFVGMIDYEQSRLADAGKHFQEACRLMESVRQAWSTPDPEFIEALADTQRNLARVQSETGVAADRVIMLLNASSENWRLLMTARRGQENRWLREQAENRLIEAGIYRRQGARDSALKAVGQAVDILVPLREKETSNDLTLGALGRAFTSLGELLYESGKLAEAQDALNQGGAALSAAVRSNGAADSHQFALAENLALIGQITGDPEKTNDAAHLLARLVAASPANLEYPALLARCYGQLAERQRDGGQVVQALELERKAVDQLRKLVDSAGETVSASLRWEMGNRLSHFSEVLGDTQNHAEAFKAAQEGIKVCSPLVTENPANRDYLVLRATLLGRAGDAAKSLGHKPEAGAFYQEAMKDWQALVTQNQSDQQAMMGVDWAKGRLEETSK